MKTLLELQRAAADAARFRGHKALKWQPPHHSEHRSYTVGACIDCGMEVCVNTHPMPNEIDIGGEAVALNCTGAQP